MASKKIIFGGDIHIADENCSVTPELKARLASADACIFNLESPIIDRDDRASANISPSPKAGPSISQSPKVIDFLRQLNCKFVSGANNHISDYGQAGIESTMKILHENGIKYGGFGINDKQASEPILIDDKIAIVCIAEEEFGVASENSAGSKSMYSDLILADTIELAKSGKFVIVYAHGGGEKIPLASNYIKHRYIQFSDFCASLVVGHHPHIPQGIETYNGKSIFYSLGDFIHKASNANWGILVEIAIEDNKIIKQEIIPVERTGNQIGLAAIPQKYLDYINKISQVIKNGGDLEKGLYQEQAMWMYESFYKRYLTGKFSSKKSWKNLFKTPAKSQRDELLLLHLFRNNSHREFITTALKLWTGEIKDKRTPESHALFEELRAFIDASFTKDELKS